MSQVPRLAHLRRRQCQSPKTSLVPTIMNLEKERPKHTFTVVSWLILSFLYLIKHGLGLSLTIDEAGIHGCVVPYSFLDLFSLTQDYVVLTGVLGEVLYTRVLIYSCYQGPRHQL